MDSVDNKLTNLPQSCCDPVVKSKQSEPKSSSTCIDDLPEVALVEILSRLPSCESLVQCKCVSKRWCNLLSEPYLIGRFLWLRMENIPPIVTRSSPVVHSHFGCELYCPKAIEMLRCLLGMIEMRDPLMLPTWNDLALCCKGCSDRPSYFICNLRTMQLVTLPPAPRGHSYKPVAFMCEPCYYKEDVSDIDQQNQREVIKVNADFRFKVVRILVPDLPREKCLRFKIQVFSSEIGEWRESVVPCPRGCSTYCISLDGFAGNGMLYWRALNGILALGPFSNGADDQGYQFHLIWTSMDEYEPVCLGVYQGRLRFYDYSFDSEFFELYFWELTEEELNQMAVAGGGKLGLKPRTIHLNLRYLKETGSGYDLNPAGTAILGFEPTNLDIYYVRMGGVFLKGNIRLGWLSEIDVESYNDVSLKIFRTVLPWPTPVPRLPQHGNGLG